MFSSLGDRERCSVQHRNGQVALAVVNVSDALSLGALMVTDFRKSLPARFHAKLGSPVKTMEKLKHGIKIGEQVVFDLESIFFVFCWSVSNVRWNSCQSSDTNCVPFLRRLWTSMADSGEETRQYSCIGLE